MQRSQFYREALANVGLAGTLRRGVAKNFGKDDMRLTSRYLDHPVFARRGTTDLTVFDQIFVEREYRCLDHLSGLKTIIDLGANCGFSSSYLLSRFPESRLIAVEPDEGNFEALQRNLAAYGDRAMAMKGAVWSHCTELSFKAETTSPGNEWGRRMTGDAPATALRVKAWDIPTIMQAARFERIDLLKMDIEGAEAEIFSASSLDWIDRVGSMVIELHGPECEAALDKALHGRGFALSRCGELTVCLRT